MQRPLGPQRRKQRRRGRSGGSGGSSGGSRKHRLLAVRALTAGFCGPSSIGSGCRGARGVHQSYKHMRPTAWRPGSGVQVSKALLALIRTLGGRAAFLPFLALPPFFLIAPPWPGCPLFICKSKVGASRDTREAQPSDERQAQTAALQALQSWAATACWRDANATCKLGQTCPAQHATLRRHQRSMPSAARERTTAAAGLLAPSFSNQGYSECMYDCGSMKAEQRQVFEGSRGGEKQMLRERMGAAAHEDTWYRCRRAGRRAQGEACSNGGAAFGGTRSGVRIGGGGKTVGSKRLQGSCILGGIGE